MGVKDIYGKEVSRETHMKFSYNPITLLIDYIKNGRRKNRITKKNLEK